jgi:hypothetical protein
MGVGGVVAIAGVDSILIRLAPGSPVPVDQAPILVDRFGVAEPALAALPNPQLAGLPGRGAHLGDVGAAARDATFGVSGQQVDRRGAPSLRVRRSGPALEPSVVVAARASSIFGGRDLLA